jgi:hypothetical protein
VEDEGGVRHVQNDEWTYVRDGAGRMQRQPTSSIFWSFGGGHPAVLLGNAQQRHERFSDTDDFCVPIGAASAVEVAGRLAWEFALRPPPRKPHPLRVAIDDETGAVLRMAIPELAMPSRWCSSTQTSISPRTSSMGRAGSHRLDR